MSDIIINSKYAPGISTYGIKGVKGEVGQAGYSLYFSPYKNIDDENLKNSIKNNIFITDNVSLSNELHIMKNRNYQVNDLFLTKSGEVYRLNDVENVTFDKEPLFDLYSLLNVIVDTSTNTISNVDGKKMIITSSSDSSDINTDAMLTIKTKTNENYISLLTSDSSLTIKNGTIDTSNYIIFDSSSDICINSLYVANDITANDKIDIDNKSYYKVITKNILNDIDITDIVDVSNGLITLKIPCEYRYITNENTDNVFTICYGNPDDEFSIDEYKVFEVLIHNTNYITKYIDVLKYINNIKQNE